MKRNRIVNQRRDIALGKMSAKFVTLWDSHNKQMVIALARPSLHPERQFAKRFTIPRRNLAPAVIPFVEGPEADSKNRRMNLIKTAVFTWNLRRIILPLAIVAQQPGFLCNRPVGSHNHSAVTIGSQILCWIETERAGAAKSSASPPACITAIRMRSVLKTVN